MTTTKNILPEGTTHVMACTRAVRKSFRRAHLDFTDAWRVLELGTENDADPMQPPSTGAVTAAAAARFAEGVIGPDTLQRLLAEDMIVVKAASGADLEDAKRRAADNPGDDKARIARLEQDKADLEARLMRLELALTGGKAVDGKGGKAGEGKDDDSKKEAGKK